MKSRSKKPAKVWQPWESSVVTLEQRKFNTWFVGQYGDRKGGNRYTDRTLLAAVERGNIAKFELEGRKLWDARWTAGFQAWQARERRKTK